MVYEGASYPVALLHWVAHPFLYGSPRLKISNQLTTTSFRKRLRRQSYERTPGFATVGGIHGKAHR